MFTSEIDSRLSPLLSRARGMVLGTLIMITVAGGMISARTIPFFFAVTIAGFLVAAALRRRADLVVPRPGPIFWHAVVFLLYAAFTTAWGLDPTGALLSIALAAVFLLGALILLRAFADDTRPNLLHMNEGVWLGFAVALAYLLVETFTDQGIKIWLYNLLALREGDLSPEGYFTWRRGDLVAIAPDDMTRNMAALTMFLWPAVLAMRGGFAARPVWGRALAVVCVVVGTTVVLLSTHESSKLAIVGSLVVVLIAMAAPRIAGRLTAIGWVIACLAMLPSALLAHRLDLHNAAWLQDSARHRIIIWNYTAEQVLKAPWLGVGARTTYVLGPQLEQQGPQIEAEKFPRTLSRHSHSIYLQTWFELGLFGAVLLTLLGLSILHAIRFVALELKPYAYATFVAAALMGASSYGMWQTWFIAMYAFTVALFGLAAILVRAPAGRGAPS